MKVFLHIGHITLIATLFLLLFEEFAVLCLSFCSGEITPAFNFCAFGFSGFEVLPSRFNPPGRGEPLFTFTDP